MLNQKVIQMNLAGLTIIVTAWCLMVFNVPLWQSVLVWRPVNNWADVLYLGSFVALVFTAVFIFLTPFTLSRRLSKPLLGVLIIASSIGAYYVGHYGILIDKTMIRNVLATNSAETLELMTPGLILYVMGFGVVPAALIQLVSLRSQTVRQLLWQRIVLFVGLMAMLGVIAALSYSSHASLLRNHREVRHMLTPVNMIAGVGSLVAESARQPLPYQPIAAGVTLGPHWEEHSSLKQSTSTTEKKPLVLVLVVGETARAKNFGLNGYSRQTTPELAATTELLAFQQVTACGTSTAISVPCMFSDLAREEFALRKARARDNLLDVLEKAGFVVRWFDNNTSCNGVCGERPEIRADRLRPSDVCQADAPCFDEAIFELMWPELAAVKVNTVFVVHMLGSHGPGYHLRYPSEFEQFTPACHETDFSKCSTQEIINAYDNSILYTDHLLFQTINTVKAHSHHYDSAVWYVSDHGESLGEKGLYLHAIPYAVAPSEQLQVPMVFWSSEGLRQRMGIDASCLRQTTGRPLSHDHVFHSTLGLLDIHLPAKREALDMFSPCMQGSS
jgi:lipid A ethanolaminephosphotransferase